MSSRGTGSAGTPQAEDVAWIRVEDDTGPGTIRRHAVELAEQVGLDETRAGEIAIVATELSTNLVKHAREGVVVLRILRRGDGVGGVEIIALDHGPGMRDIRALLGNGTSTTGTLGIGLGAVRRLSSRYDVHSVPGRGTVVTASFWQDAPGSEVVTAGLTRTLAGESECGDAYGVRPTPDGRLLLIVDGLGHGPLAARAATAATRIFHASQEVSPGALMGELHAGLSGTRGAAAAIGRLDVQRGLLTCTGIGNVAGRIVTPGRTRSLVTHPGIVGHNARAVRETIYDLEPDSWVVLHSDGLSEKWDTADYPGILEHSPLVLAATLMREAGVHRDDASVLVTKATVE